MDKTPRYSFVLPAFKKRFLKDAIDSILHQTYTDFELIIVDDCSPENLFEIVSEYSDARLSYFRNETNIGSVDLVAQWNHSLEFASGEYVILASDDDVYDRDFLKIMDDLSVKYPKVNVLRPRIEWIDESFHTLWVENWIGEIKTDYISHEQYMDFFAREVIGPGIPQYVFKRQALIDKGGFISFPLAWCSDDAIVSLMSRGNGMALSNSILFHFRTWSSSITGQKSSFQVICKKIDAIVEYSSFLDSDTEISDIVILTSKNRLRRITVNLFNHGTLSELCSGLRYIYAKKSQLYSNRWLCGRFLGYCYRRLMGRV